MGSVRDSTASAARAATLRAARDRHHGNACSGRSPASVCIAAAASPGHSLCSRQPLISPRTCHHAAADQHTLINDGMPANPDCSVPPLLAVPELEGPPPAGGAAGVPCGLEVEAAACGMEGKRRGVMHYWQASSTSNLR